jgi:hypothetical protein
VTAAIAPHVSAAARKAERLESVIGSSSRNTAACRLSARPDAERFIGNLFLFRFWREIVRDALDPSQEKAR